jgi:hypothetical protein
MGPDAAHAFAIEHEPARNPGFAELATYVARISTFTFLFILVSFVFYSALTRRELVKLMEAWGEVEILREDELTGGSSRGHVKTPLQMMQYGLAFFPVAGLLRVVLAASVPVCGFVGSRRLKPGFLGCFTMCSCVYGMFSILGFFWLAMVVGSVVGSVKNFEGYLDKCSPEVCLRLPERKMKDCFAAPGAKQGREGYRVRMPRIPHLADDCPWVFLNCSEAPPRALSELALVPARALEGPPVDERLNALSAGQRRQRTLSRLLLPKPKMDCAVNEDWVRRFKDTQESVHVAAPRFMAYLCFYMVVLIPLSFWSCTGCWYGGKLLEKLYENRGSTYGDDDLPAHFAAHGQEIPGLNAATYFR